VSELGPPRNSSDQGGAPFSDTSGGVSEAVRVTAQFMRLFDRQVLEDFCVLLGDHVARGSTILTRESNLGLLRTLVSAGVFPSVASYEAAVAAEAADGEAWPSAAELAAAFGGFHRAVEMGVRYSTRQRSVRIDPSGMGASRAFTTAEIEVAIERCRMELGMAGWPSSTLFYEWGSLSRKIARVYGRGRDPRCPGMAALRRCFPSYSAACEAAARRDRWRAKTPNAGATVSSAPSSRPRRGRGRSTGVQLPD
jgi:hypothetical protein